MTPRTISVTVALAALVLFGFWFFHSSPTTTITNYPSQGTDIVAFGDSLIEGVGASSDDKNLVSLLSAKIGQPIVNLGVSGNTTADGLARISVLDSLHPKVVLLLLGGNDYLHRVPIEQTFQHLGKIIEDIQGRGAIVLLLGVRGGLLDDHFARRFEQLRDTYHTAYVSDVLAGLIGHTDLMSDEIHPNDAGYSIIAERIYPVLVPLLK